MTRMIGGSLFLTAGVLAGMASAVSAIELYGATPVAPDSIWQIWDVSAGGSPQPYSLAHYLIAGRFPPAAGQMREFSAQRATDGSFITAVCDYVLTAKPAPGGWWSMAAYASGRAAPPANALITSDTAIAENDGSVRLVVSRYPASGNWVRPPVAGNFTLLYTVAESSPSLSHAEIPVFTIDRGRC
jgi:hypothetical protein